MFLTSPHNFSIDGAIVAFLQENPQIWTRLNIPSRTDLNFLVAKSLEMTVAERQKMVSCHLIPEVQRVIDLADEMVLATAGQDALDRWSQLSDKLLGMLDPDPSKR